MNIMGFIFGIMLGFLAFVVAAEHNAFIPCSAFLLAVLIGALFQASRKQRETIMFTIGGVVVGIIDIVICCGLRGIGD